MHTLGSIAMRKIGRGAAEDKERAGALLPRLPSILSSSGNSFILVYTGTLSTSAGLTPCLTLSAGRSCHTEETPMMTGDRGGGPDQEVEGGAERKASQVVARLSTRSTVNG